MAKISTFIIGLISVSLIITLFNLFLGGVNQEYHASTYDQGDLDTYNKLDELTDQSEEIKDEITSIQSKPNIIDVIGGFFENGYRAMKLTYTSFDTFDSMTDDALEDAHLGKTGEYLKIAIGGIVIVLIFVGVVVAAFLKWNI